MFLSNFSFTLHARHFGNIYQHPDLVQMSATYMRIRDCLLNRVKDKGKMYLPDPSELREDARIRDARYIKYHQRAVFLPVTKRTQQGLVAQVFSRKPTIVDGNIDEATLRCISVHGHDIEAFANYIMRELTAMGRGVIVVGADQRAMMDFIEADNVITWSELPYGQVDDLGRNIQSVLLRTFLTTLSDDGITPKQIARLMQYRLDDRGYAYVRFLQSDWSNGVWSNYVPIIVRGAHLRHLPVYPVGSESNTLSMDSAPLDELSALNISHYINSADYEEHVYIAGQVTTVISGLNQTWYDTNVKNKLGFGVRAPMPLQKDSKAYLLQAQANSTAKEALDKKEGQMIAVGARLIEQRQIRRTATESSLEAESYDSILGHIAKNAASGLTAALRELGAHFDGDNSKNSIALNTEFGMIATSSEHRRLCLEEWQSGVRTFPEYRRAMRTYDDTLSADDAAARKEIEAEIEFREKLSSVGSKAAEPKGGDNRSKPPTKTE